MGAVTAELVVGDEKRDSSGRQLAGATRREAVLEAYDRSGLTQREFAAREGINYHTFVTWLCRRRQEQRARLGGPSGVRFAEVRMPGRGGVTEVCLPSGIVIRGGDAEQVAVLVKALSR